MIEVVDDLLLNIYGRVVVELEDSRGSAALRGESR